MDCGLGVVRRPSLRSPGGGGATPFCTRSNTRWPPGEVSIAHRPTDCDFWRAPIGEKPCHYEKQVYGHLPGGAIYDAQKDRVISQAGDESRLDRNSEFESVSVFWTKKAIGSA